MESHDAEFSDHGRTPPRPLTDPEKLDAEWKRLAGTDDDVARSLYAKFQRVAEEYETCLGELRDLARMSLTEKRFQKHSCGMGEVCTHDI